MNDKMKVKINEDELRDMIAKSVNEALKSSGRWKQEKNDIHNFL